MTAPLELTILMPCLNEAETLAVCIRKARAFLERAGIAGEVLIADNGSTDGSQQIAAAEGARVVPVAAARLRRGADRRHRGRAAAATSSWAMPTTATTSRNLDAFVERLRAGDQLVMGNRFKGGIAPGAMPWHHKYIGNPVLSFLGRLFFKHRAVRLPLRPARLRSRRHPRPQPAHHRHGVRLRNAGEGDALAASRSPRSRPRSRRTAARRPPHLRSLPRRLAAPALPAAVLAALALPLSRAMPASPSACSSARCSGRGPVNLSPTVQLDLHTFLVAAMLRAGRAAGRELCRHQPPLRLALRLHPALRHASTACSKFLTLERLLILAAVLIARRPRRAGLGLRRNGPPRDFGPLQPRRPPCAP